VLVVFRGLPGTSKSFLVRRLAARRPDLLVRSRDVLRRLVPRPSFSTEEKNLVDGLIASMAGYLLERGRDVVIDGMALSSAEGVQRLVREAESRNAPVRIIECACRQETALARIRGDEGSHPAADRGEALYFQVKARYQQIPYPCLAVDTDADSAGCLAAILDYLGPEG
jgi:predicted kinase